MVCYPGDCDIWLYIIWHSLVVLCCWVVYYIGDIQTTVPGVCIVTNKIELNIKYNSYHPAYGHSYTTYVTCNGKAHHLHSKFNNLFIHMDELIELIKEFSNYRPCYINSDHWKIDRLSEFRRFDYSYSVKWDYASQAKIEFYPRVG